MDNNFHKLTYNHLLRHANDISTRGLALSEFIDNSIQSYLETSPNENEIGNISGCKIDIVIDESDPQNIKILIRDNAGGMSENRLLDASKEFHNSLEKSSCKINQYGIGMKLAIFWFGTNGKIWTKKKNLPEYMLDYETDKHEPNDPVVTPIVESTESRIDGHGTIIQIENIRDTKRILLNSNTTKATLEDVYETIRNRFREYIKNGLIITFKLITYDEPKEKEILKIAQQNVIDTDVFKTKAFTLNGICGIKDIGDITDREQLLLSSKKKLFDELKNLPQLQNNTLYKKLFNKIEIGARLEIEEKIILNKKDLKVKLCFMNEANSKYCGVAIKHCERYIHHTPNLVSRNIGTMPFSTDVKYLGGMYKWVYAEVDLTDVEKYGLEPDKNKSSFVWDEEKQTDWYNGFQNILIKYEDFIDLFLKRITKNTDFNKNSKKWKKQHEMNNCAEDLKFTDWGYKVEIDESSLISKIYKLDNTKIEIIKSENLNSVFSWEEMEDNYFKLQYNNNDDKYFSPEMFTEVYFLRLVALIKLITIGKYSANNDILDIINNVLKG